MEKNIDKTSGTNYTDQAPNVNLSTPIKIQWFADDSHLTIIATRKPSVLDSHRLTNYELAIMTLKLKQQWQLQFTVRYRSESQKKACSFIFCRRICGFSTISSSTQSLPDGNQQFHWRFYYLQNNFSRSSKVILWQNLPN